MPSIDLRRDFLFSFGVAALSEGGFSVVTDESVSSRSIDGRALIALAFRIALTEGFAPEAPYGLAAEEARACAESFWFGEPVPAAAAAGEATSPGLAVAPAVPVTSVPAFAPLEAATATRGPGLTP